MPQAEPSLLPAPPHTPIRQSKARAGTLTLFLNSLSLWMAPWCMQIDKPELRHFKKFPDLLPFVKPIHFTFQSPISFCLRSHATSLCLKPTSLQCHHLSPWILSIISVVENCSVFDYTAPFWKPSLCLRVLRDMSRGSLIGRTQEVCFQKTLCR